MLAIMLARRDRFDEERDLDKAQYALAKATLGDHPITMKFAFFLGNSFMRMLTNLTGPPASPAAKKIVLEAERVLQDGLRVAILILGENHHDTQQMYRALSQPRRFLQFIKARERMSHEDSMDSEQAEPLRRDLHAKVKQIFEEKKKTGDWPWNPAQEPSQPAESPAEEVD